MNERMKTQLEVLCRQPEKFNGTPEDAQRMTDRIKAMLEEDRIETDDLMKIARGYDLNLKSLMMMAYTPYGVIFEDTINDCIERDDLNTLLFISSAAIASHEGRFYTVNSIKVREHNEISEDTLNRLREYLLKNRCPLNARNVSSPGSFWKVNKLNEAVCDEITLMKYIFLAGGIRIPYTDQLSIAFFNQLEDADKEYVLEQLIASYEKFSFSKVDDSTVTVDDEGSGISMFIAKADFDALETDSPKKAELIALQNKIFG